METYTVIALYLDAWIVSIALYIYYRKNMHIPADPDCSGVDWWKVMGSAIVSVITGLGLIIITIIWIWKHS